MTHSNRSRRVVTAAAGAALVALALSVPLQAAPSAREVKVINTPARAVPVAVQGTPSVTVGNALSKPVPTRRADDPARRALQRTGLVIIAAGDQIEDQTLYTVPAGKRLVIEEASVRAQLFTGVSQAMVFLRSTGGGGIGGHYVPLESLGVLNGYGTVLVGTELLRGYADPGTTVDASVSINTASGGGGRIEVTFTGYLVDL
jgi:hypothetical protein